MAEQKSPKLMQPQTYADIGKLPFIDKVWILAHLQGCQSIVWTQDGSAILVDMLKLEVFLNSTHTVFYTRRVSEFLDHLYKSGLKRVYLRDKELQFCHMYYHECFQNQRWDLLEFFRKPVNIVIDPVELGVASAAVESSDVTPSKEAPSNEAPSNEAPSSEAPSKEAPSNEAPSNEAPSSEAPSNEAPSNEAPSNEAPSSVAAIEDEAEKKESPPPKTPSSNEAVAQPAARSRTDLCTTSYGGLTAVMKSRFYQRLVVRFNGHSLGLAQALKRLPAEPARTRRRPDGMPDNRLLQNVELGKDANIGSLYHNPLATFGIKEHADSGFAGYYGEVSVQQLGDFFGDFRPHLVNGRVVVNKDDPYGYEDDQVDPDDVEIIDDCDIDVDQLLIFRRNQAQSTPKPNAMQVDGQRTYDLVQDKDSDDSVELVPPSPQPDFSIIELDDDDVEFIDFGPSGGDMKATADMPVLDGDLFNCGPAELTAKQKANIGSQMRATVSALYSHDDPFAKVQQ